MPFSPPTIRRERILDLGPAGSGKTSNFLHIAQMSALTGSPSRFFVGDSDFAMDAMLPGYEAITPYLSISQLYDWDDYMAFGKFLAANVTPDDWLCVDFIGSAWKAVQEYYVAQVFKKDIGDYFLAARKKEVAELEGWVDWQVINPLYQQWIMPLLFKLPCHKFCTAKSDPLSDSKRPTESPQLRSMFLPYGIKPVGQKDLAFQFHTVLVSGRDAAGNRVINTVKDRQRIEVKGQVVTNFAQDYLMNVAGWGVTA